MTRAFAASLVLHALSLAALAYVVLPQSALKYLEIVQHEPFAGQQTAIEFSVARPAAEAPQIQEPLPVESPVTITPAGAQFRQHVYVEKTTEQVMQEPPAMRRVPSEVSVPAPMIAAAAEDSPSANPTAAENSAASQVSVPRTPRRVQVATSSLASIPQTLGTRERTSAQMSNNRPPRYPEIAQRHGWEGTVLLKLKIDAAGNVSGVEVVRSSGHSILDAEAVSAVRVWRGEPATENGRPVASEAYLPVRFRL
jgi:protein TonB